MNDCRTTFRILPLLLLAACGPKGTDADDDHTEPVEQLDDACASFCRRALSCPLGRYAELWNFQDEQACVAECLEFHADTPSDPPEMCVIIRADLWSCGGALESCEVFDAFEDTTFEEPNTLGNPCFDEFQDFIGKCNY
jgi:hypothetical protein